MARPHSEVRRRGTGIRRIGTPPFFSRFSADRTLWVPRKIRIIPWVTAFVTFPPNPDPEIVRNPSGIHYNGPMGFSAGIPQANWVVPALIAAASLGMNLPLGYAREGFRRFSPGWFVCVHLSVPVIAYLRLSHHVTGWAIPAFIACAVLGQVAGGRVRRGRHAGP